jgi:serine/threonine protein kinase
MQLAQRLTVVKDIASALQYMHDGAHVICRDIKPDNIGFYRNPHPTCQCGWRSKQLPHPLSPTIVQDCICYDEVPKLFDFGLCKELKSKYLKAHPHHCPQDRVETYNLTARSGSRRYMAPEVARSLPYNEKADVYSFGILLYQMASLLKPFEGYTLVEHEEKVLCSGHRPNVEIPSAKGSSSSYSQWFAQSSDGKKKDLLELRTKCVWTEELKQLIEECWHFDMRLRPEMREVVLRLEGCIQELTCVTQVIASNNSNEVKRMSVQSKCVAKASRA